MNPSRLTTLMAAAAIVWVAACTNQKEPAEQAVARVESSVEAMRADAQKYAADKLAKVDESVDHLKKTLANKDYGGVMIASRAVESDVADLKAAVDEAKVDAEETLAAAQTEWNDLSSSVPPMVDKLQSRVEQLSRSHHYPKGMNQSAFNDAKAGVASLKSEWSEVSQQFASGESADAVRKARQLKARAEELSNELEVQA
jgi:DNA repair exonuclease SbcCD ATPase subunit